MRALRVLHVVAEELAARSDIDRHVERAQLGDGEQRQHVLGTVVEDDRHPRAARHAPFSETMRELIGDLLQLAVADHIVAMNQKRRIRISVGPVLQNLRYHAVCERKVVHPVTVPCSRKIRHSWRNTSPSSVADSSSEKIAPDRAASTHAAQLMHVAGSMKNRLRISVRLDAVHGTDLHAGGVPRTAAGFGNDVGHPRLLEGFGNFGLRQFRLVARDDGGEQAEHLILRHFGRRRRKPFRAFPDLRVMEDDIRIVQQMQPALNAAKHLVVLQCRGLDRADEVAICPRARPCR